MYTSDLKHHDQTLEEKLHTLYTLNRDKKIDLSFRPPYLDLLRNFGNPHLNLPPMIHVAGTNGKGSIIAILRNILETAGYKVHAYTSPHLQTFNERIYLAGQNITDHHLENLIDEAITHNENQDVTFFEITTALAFAAFSQTPADVLLLEVGLGGRLDCTNVIKAPIISIINTVSYDHQEHLGETLPQIAAEKAGIIKQETPCILGPQNPDTTDVFAKIAAEKKAPLYKHGTEWDIKQNSQTIEFTWQCATEIYPKPGLTGPHQIQNTENISCIVQTFLR